MFDKQKIIAMTAALEEFVRTHPNIYILPEVWKIEIFPLLKRLNANVVGILTNAPVNPNQNIIQTPSGNYPLVNLQEMLSKITLQSGVIISSAKETPNPIFPMAFNFGNATIVIPAFSITAEEARVIYDRLTTLNIIRQYQNDGIINRNIEGMSVRFARGMSTFIDSQFQGLKIQNWDRRNIKTPYFDIPDTAIVIQGPLLYADNYTITTARLYREWYPNAPIIISTWKNEATNAFREACKKINVVLLENELPEEMGAFHINYQLESSFKGIDYVKSHSDAKFVLKCRTDQRINKPDFLIYFKNLFKLYPPNGDKLNGRIAVAGLQKYIPFFVGDFLYFATVEDLSKFFSIPKQTPEDREYTLRLHSRFVYVGSKIPQFKFLSLKDVSNNKRKLRNYNVVMSKFSNAEIFITRNFYEKYIAQIDPEKLLKIYWEFIRDYLIVCDDFMLEWSKYFDVRQYGMFSDYHKVSRYSDWLDIYLNYKDED